MAHAGVDSRVVQNPANNDYYHLILPRGWNGNGQQRAVITRVGSGGTTAANVVSHQGDPDGASQAFLPDHHVTLARNGFPVVEIGTLGATWGNATGRAAVDAAWTYMKNTIGCKTDKVMLMGASAGFAALGNWATRNKASVAALLGLMPAVNVDYVHDNNVLGLQATINAAHGGSDATWETAKTTHDPYLLTNDYESNDFPCKIMPITGDPILPIAHARTFATSSGCIIEEVAGTAHTTSYVPLDAPRDYLEAYRA